MTKKDKKTSEVSSKVNFRALRELIVKESRFITDLIDRLPIPVVTEEDEAEGRGSSKSGLLGAPGTTEKKNSRAQSLEELMSKLKTLQGQKSNYKTKLAKKGLKNKMKKKKKNDERILNKKLVRAQKSGDRKTGIISSENKLVKPVKPVFNSEGKLVFSKFDFSNVGSKDRERKEERDPKKILKQMEKQKEKIAKLQSEGATEKVNELKEKQAWRLALKKAQGVKVKDDPELLKKSVKRVEQRKKSSAKKWKGREEQVKKSQDDKQKKRQQNIQQRKEQNKQKKTKKNVKKGRVMPGF